VLGSTKQERRDRVLKGGLKIYASLDPKLQQDAQNAMDAVLPEKPGWTGSLVSIDPTTGLPPGLRWSVTLNGVSLMWGIDDTILRPGVYQQISTRAGGEAVSSDAY